MSGYRTGTVKRVARSLGITPDDYLARIASGLKRCRKCHEWRPLSTFAKDRSRYDGLKTTCFDCDRVKERKCQKGRPSAFKGRTHSPEARARMGAARLGNHNRLGKPFTPEAIDRLRQIARLVVPRGARSHLWRGGITGANKLARKNFRYREWRRLVFERDSYACQRCGDTRGGNLHAHHIKFWSTHPTLRYDVDNGLTVCVTCHEAIHSKPIPSNRRSQQ